MGKQWEFDENGVAYYDNDGGFESVQVISENFGVDWGLPDLFLEFLSIGFNEAKVNVKAKDGMILITKLESEK